MILYFDLCLIHWRIERSSIAFGVVKISRQGSNLQICFVAYNS